MTMKNFFNSNIDFPWNVIDNACERGRKLLSTKKSELDPKLVDLKLEKLAPYLYSIEYSNIDYEKIDAQMENIRGAGMCSSVKFGKFVGRNFDWFFDHAATFVLRTTATENRHGSIGVAACYTNYKLTEGVASSGKWSPGYDLLPGLMLDGVNDCGVSCTINVVPLGDKGVTTGTNSSGKDLCQINIARFVLDNATSALEAIHLLEERNIYTPLKTLYDYHFLISDSERAYIVEFPNNTMHVMSDNPNDEYDNIPNIDTPIMTNFYLTGWNGEIKTGFEVEGGISPEETTLTKHSAGLERYAILQKGLPNVESAEDMQKLMYSVFYTQMYKLDTDPFWYSEYCMNWGEPYGDFTIYNYKDDFKEVIELGVNAFSKTTRDFGKTWVTAHSSVYDLEEKRLILTLNEDPGHIYTFKL